MIATGSGHGLKLMVGQITECTAGGGKCVIKLVVRIVHLIDAENGFQTAFIKWFVVSHERQPFYQWFYLRPHLREYRGIIRILTAKAMHLTAPVIIIVRLRLDERVKRIYNLTIAHNDDTYRAYAAALIVGRFEVYCCKIMHFFETLFGLKTQSVFAGRLPQMLGAVSAEIR